MKECNFTKKEKEVLKRVNNSWEVFIHIIYTLLVISGTVLMSWWASISVVMKNQIYAAAFVGVSVAIFFLSVVAAIVSIWSNHYKKRMGR